MLSTSTADFRKSPTTKISASSSSEATFFSLWDLWIVWDRLVLGDHHLQGLRRSRAIEVNKALAQSSAVVTGRDSKETIGLQAAIDGCMGGASDGFQIASVDNDFH